MSAGTITLTNNSAAVSGAGTAFTTDLKAGDFIVSAVGGVTYTLPVKTVNSATGVTLLKNYDGPTQAGAAWSAVPRDTMNAITAQLAAETAQALRGLNYDKKNWQSVFSSNGNITIILPDGSSFSGPSWNSIVSALASKADVSALADKADVRNPVFKGGYLTREGDGSFVQDNYNTNGHPSALGTRTQIHINLHNNDLSAVSDYLFVRRPASGSSGQIVVALPKTGGTLALLGTSGINFKKDISDADPEEAFNRINALRLVNYIYKDDESERVRFGIIAEEAEKIAPQYIKHNQEYVDDVIDPVTNEIIEKIYRDRPLVDVNPIVMDLLGAIQVLNSKVNEQEKRLLELEKMKLSIDK